MLTTAAVATELNVSRSRVLKLIAAGRLPAVKIGRDWQIRSNDIELVRVRRPGRPLGVFTPDEPETCQV